MSRFQSIYDSQETEAPASQELFGQESDREQTVPVSEKLLKDILQELKDLRKSIEELKRSSETREKTTLFRIEDQGFHKTYFQYLKGLFCSFPWLDIENEDFKREVKELVGENPCKFRSMCSFASQKFTQMRNQLRRMLFHSTMDIQALSLDGLCNYLYRPFTPPGESPVDKKRRKMTVALRAFLSTKKFNECEKFWPEFKEFYASIKEDLRPNIWDLLQEKEERRIKRYQDEQEREK
ncbi:uncharacterized protein LOC128169941 [Crassostrea angulata]|uniref:uncharacterized protein LOC128169941 n=1 Tax=Magallana angulata TaxID=2784310 RepID=UPI0022B0876A|nr:uncharacterized protein LOC128169941 [Crassostrea angulata]